MVRYGRRSLLTALALLAVQVSSQRPALAEDSAASFAAWVNTLYVGAVLMREAAEAGTGADLSDREIQSLFTPAVQAMRDSVADRTLPPDEPEGPILHILFGWGALLGRRIEIVSVIAKGTDRARVNLTIDGTPRPLLLKGRFNVRGNAWQIDDIDYGEGRPDRTLRGRLERMQDWPKP